MIELNKEYKGMPESIGFREKRTVEGINYRRIAKMIKHGKILDVGCSTGDFISFLDKDIEYYGLDNNIERISYAKERYPKGKFYTSFGEKMPFEDNTFDYVVITEIIEHVESPLSLLIECKRVLKQDGKLIGSTPNPTDFNRIVKSILRKEHGSIEHLSIFGSFEIRNLLRCTGLDKVGVEFTLFSFNFPKLKIRIKSLFLTWLFPYFGEGIIFYGDKK